MPLLHSSLYNNNQPDLTRGEAVLGVVYPLTGRLTRVLAALELLLEARTQHVHSGAGYTIRDVALIVSGVRPYAVEDWLLEDLGPQVMSGTFETD
jgi:hypothetical protein